jgi:hypothetical protein
MRDLINKLTLLESNTANLTKIASFFIAWSDVINLPIKFKFPYMLPYTSQEEQLMQIEMVYTKDEAAGSLKSEGEFRYMKFVNEKLEKFYGNIDSAEAISFTHTLEDIIVRDLFLDLEQSRIRASARKGLLEMGFSSAAAEDFTDNLTPQHGNVVVRTLAPTGKFHTEVNEAYQWRQERIGDL